jgi:hypothetical protein
MGILANHVASIEQLKPGVIEVVESPGTSKKFFGESVLQRLNRKEHEWMHL